MNLTTIDLVQRPYPDIVDDILTAMVGGVVREPIPFDVKQDLYPLSRKAADIRSIVGSHTPQGGEAPAHTTFIKGVDYLFDQQHNAVVWQPAGTKPDDTTTFYVDYYRPDVTSPLTDLNVGSVTRTLSEAIGREIATVFQQVNQAYLAGYVDTAQGQALDLVVSILGVTRKGANFASGLVTFLRQAGVDGAITIPEGALLTTAKGEASFITEETATLQQGQVRIDVQVRASDASAGPGGVVAAGAITTMAQPIAGIASITNLDATSLAAAAETDDQLRLRAKSALLALNKATIAGLSSAIVADGGKLDQVWDPNSPDHQADPGTVTLLVEVEPQRMPSLRSAVDQDRAAGVLAAVVARYVFFRPRTVARIAAADMPADVAGQTKLIGQIIAAMQAHVNGLKAGQALDGSAFVGDVVKAVKELGGEATNLRIVDLMTWRANIGAPGPDATVDALLSAIANTPAGNTAALRAALTEVVTAIPTSAPTADRVPDPSLIQGLTGGTATPAEIEAGKFRIQPSAPLADGVPWQVVLDIALSDIKLVVR